MLKCKHCGKVFEEGENIFRIERGFAYCEECGNKLFTIEEQDLITSGYMDFDGVNQPKADKEWYLENVEIYGKDETDRNRKIFFEESNDSTFWTEYYSENDDIDEV